MAYASTLSRALSALHQRKPQNGAMNTFAFPPSHPYNFNCQPTCRRPTFRNHADRHAATRHSASMNNNSTSRTAGSDRRSPAPNWGSAYQLTIQIIYNCATAVCSPDAANVKYRGDLRWKGLCQHRVIAVAAPWLRSSRCLAEYFQLHQDGRNNLHASLLQDRDCMVDVRSP